MNSKNTKTSRTTSFGEGAIRWFLVLALGLFLNAPVQAATSNWTGNVSTDWNTSGNWSGTVPNGPSDEANFITTTDPNVDLAQQVDLSAINFLMFDVETIGDSFSINTNNHVLDFHGFGINNTSGSNQWIVNSGLNGYLGFFNSSSADYANSGKIYITNDAILEFNDASNAGYAVITTNNGGQTKFSDTSDGSNGTFIVNNGGLLDVSNSINSSGVSVGSFEGDGSIYLGNQILTTGSNGNSTLFSGVISDNGTTGQLVKTGEGTLTLSGANTYSGGTSIASGYLQVDTNGTLGLGSVYVGEATLNFLNGSLAGSNTYTNYGYINFYSDEEDDSIFSSADNATFANYGTLSFYGTSTAANSEIYNYSPTTVNFYDNSTAGEAYISNTPGNTVSFWDCSTAADSLIDNNGNLDFHDRAKAGNSEIYNYDQGYARFCGRSSAENAYIENGAEGGYNAFLSFEGRSTAGDAVIDNYATGFLAELFEYPSETNGGMAFYDKATAGNSTINNYGELAFFDCSKAGTATINNYSYNTLVFADDSSADHATILNDWYNGTLFLEGSTAGHSTITNNGYLEFTDDSNAGNAVITTNSGDDSPGGTYISGFAQGYDTNCPLPNGAQFIVNNGGLFDISNSWNEGGVTVGSIAGAGQFYLGGQTLTTGANNLDTTVSGNITDEYYWDEEGDYGRLNKIGTGTLTLTNFNGYFGGTNIYDGTIAVDTYGTLGFGDVYVGTEDSANEGVSLTFFHHANAEGNTYYNYGSMGLNDGSNAGDSEIYTYNLLNFNDDSNAGDAYIYNSYYSYTPEVEPAVAAVDEPVYVYGTVNFNDRSSAGNASIENYYDLNFRDQSTAANSTINNYNSDTVHFSDNASAGSAYLYNHSYAGMLFSDNSTAAGAWVSNGGYLQFEEDSTAGGSLIENYYEAAFIDGATADESTINNYGGLYFDLGEYSDVAFGLSPSAGHSTINNYEWMEFNGEATADNSTILNGANYGEGPQPGVLGEDSASLEFNEYSTAGSANITNNGCLTFNDSSTADYSTITNNAYLAFNGDGLQEETSVSVVEGNSTAANSNITNNGYMAFNDASSAENSIITNNGSLNFNDDATAEAAEITTGMVSGKAYVSLEDYSTGGTARFIVGDYGMFDISDNDNGEVWVGSIEGSGYFFLGWNGLITGLNDLSTTVSGQIAGYEDEVGEGGALIKVGEGDLALTGYNTYGYGTYLEEGSISVGSSHALGIGDVIVDGGILQTTGGPQLISVGEYEEPGEIVNYASYYQSSEGTLRLGIGGLTPGQSDFLLVAGDVELDGLLDTFAYNDFVPNVGDAVQIIAAEGEDGVDGTFSSWTNPTDTRWLPVYTPNDVFLLSIQPSFEIFGETDNEKAIGAALDNGFQDPELYDLILAIGTETDEEVLKDFYNQISPAGLGSLFNMGFALSQNQGDLIRARLMGPTGGNGGSSSASNFFETSEAPMFAGLMSASHELQIARSLGKKRKVSAPVAEAAAKAAPAADNWNVYTQGVGNYGQIGSTSGAAGYDFTVGGIVFGLDKNFGKDLRIGAMGGYSQAASKTLTNSKVDVVGGQFGLYAGLTKGGFYVNGFSEVGVNQYKTERVGLGGLAMGQTNGYQLSAELGTGYNFGSGTLKIGPYGSAQYTYVALDAFSETGSMAPLNIANQGMGAMRTELGAQANWTWAMGKDGGISPSLGMAWEHQYQGNQDAITAGMGSENSGFAVTGPTTGTEAALFNVGLSIEFSSKFSIYGQYQAKAGLTNFAAQSAVAGLNIGF